jgi:hypothetical protein
MTCREARNRLVGLFDQPPCADRQELESHMAACAACAREYAAIQAAMGRIEPSCRVTASPDFKVRVMKKMMEVPMEVEDAPRRWRILPRLAWLAAAAAVAVILLAPRGQSPAVSLLAQSAEAMANLQSVHIIARMRTLPADNFEQIDPKLDWVPIEIWKQFGNPPKWRVEKPGRVAVMDGTSSLLFLKPDHAVKGGPQPGFLDWMNSLLDTDKIMENELASARAQRSTARLQGEAVDEKGARHMVLVVKRAAEGNFANDWMLNKSVGSANHSRVYSFDPVGKRLQRMQLVLHAKAGDVAVFEITEIRYNEAFDPALFSLSLPADVNWMVGPERMAVVKALPQSPKEAAAMFFDGLSRQDADTLLAVYPANSVPVWAKEMAGLQVISLGEPFQSGAWRGWFVPYEISIHGHVKKHNLAVRNDNPAHRWMFDGGF